MKILVLGGCGMMGSECSRDLASTAKDAERIAIADVDLERARELADKLGGGRVDALKVDVRDEQGLAKLMSNFDVVANCTTYHYGLGATRAAINAKVNYVDLGGLHNTPRQLALDELAKEAGITVCLGCGATPGVTNVLARMGASKMEKLDAVHIAFASFRYIAASPGLLDTILDEFAPNKVRFYHEDGRLIEVEPFAGARTFPFEDPIGPQETYYVPHSETHTIPKFIGGMHRMDVRGTWQPEIMADLKWMLKMGLLDADPVLVGDVRIPPRTFMRSHLLARKPPEEAGTWAFYLAVELEGKMDGRSVRRLYTTRHPGMDHWGKAATAKMTGIPASIGAQLIARGRVKVKGVVAPEACFEPAEFLKELALRGIHVREQVFEDTAIV